MTGTPAQPIRVAVLWTRLSGYMNACLKELARRESVELLVCYARPSNDAPFDASQFEWMQNAFSWIDRPQKEELTKRLSQFNPDILLFSGWHQPVYCEIAQAWSGKSLRIMTMDNGWNGTARQFVGVAAQSRKIRSMADCVWLPGERQAVFAHRLGFGESAILRGVYTCDKDRFDDVYTARRSAGRPLPKAFVFVGRFVEEKGIHTLVGAYKAYRARVSKPWPLICCGAGPLQEALDGIEGIEIAGFRQPDQLPDTLAQCGCLVLPSLFEPWAVVVHEAVSAGLIVLASDKVGASVHLVQPGYNGYIVDAGNQESLASAMARVTCASDARREEMSAASAALSLQYSPANWSNVLLEAYSNWKAPHAARRTA